MLVRKNGDLGELTIVYRASISLCIWYIDIWWQKGVTWGNFDAILTLKETGVC